MGLGRVDREGETASRFSHSLPGPLSPFLELPCRDVVGKPDESENQIGHEFKSSGHDDCQVEPWKMVQGSSLKSKRAQPAIVHAKTDLNVGPPLGLRASSSPLPRARTALLVRRG